jgi:NAD(P)-dependent dehydrogenase (short-subunit alcohol dehydrogenase family)
MGELSGRVAIVTGSSRGIGAATARALAAAGASVVLAARGESDLRALEAEITAGGGTALAVPTDVTDPASVADLVERTVAAFGRLDVAVNNAAAGNHPPTPLADIPLDGFEASVAVAVRGTFLCLKYQIPAMLDTGGGAIVNMASTAGLEAVAGLSGYVATKFAVIGLTRTAALDYAARGIRVNALAPGPIHTEQLERAGERARAGVAMGVPARRLGRPEEVAAAAVWLCGPHSTFVTGATLTVDGGMMAGMPSFARQ